VKRRPTETSSLATAVALSLSLDEGGYGVAGGPAHVGFQRCGLGFPAEVVSFNSI
jgi:hypothetical protein